MKHIATLVLLATACSAQSPIACNLKALTRAEREHHAELSRKWRAAAIEIRELTNGLMFRLSPAIRITDLAAWVEAERKCCPFLDFNLKLQCEGGPIELTLTGRDGVKELLLATYKLTSTDSSKIPGGN
jgi:hypothetical protein